MRIFNLSGTSYGVRLIVATVCSVAFALILLTLFSIIVYFTGYTSGLLTAIKLIIRLLSVGLCALILVKNTGGLLNGSLAGLLSSIGVQLAFSLISSTFNWGEFAFNLLFCVIFGALFGIIFVNLKNNSKSS